MKIQNADRIFIICCVMAIAIVFAGVITLCVYSNYASGVDLSDIEITVDGVDYNGRAEVKAGAYEIGVKAPKGADYYISVDSNYGYVSDNKVVHINDGLSSFTVIPLRITLVKQNYALSEYVCNFIVASK